MHKSNSETSGIYKLNKVVFSKINMKTFWDLEIHLTLDTQSRIYSIRRCFWQQKFPSFSKQEHIQIWQLKLLMNFLGKILMVGGPVSSVWGRQHILLVTPRALCFWDRNSTMQHRCGVPQGTKLHGVHPDLPREQALVRLNIAMAAWCTGPRRQGVNSCQAKWSQS